ncbi:DUF6944 family repetitive protein [Bacillus weihaiensis]|uniref:DUF6944 family repetitive protein n=1 Tax=Bacillus weihaiensis TaxID=1547283 RepID=UPI002356145C|nr:hypothetical protein [Bacillus weihaiensis]
MNNQEVKANLGSQIQAIGTILSAIAASPSPYLNEKELDTIDLWGNVLQASGNALVADSEETFTLDKLGNIIQSTGNSTIIAGSLLDVEEKTLEILSIQGNLLQALGGAASFADALGQKPSLENLYGVYGNLLQTIGNSLQALAVRITNKEKSTDINFTGSWIQAVGSVLSAIGQSKS